jgi:hypothetical protein
LANHHTASLPTSCPEEGGGMSRAMTEFLTGPGSSRFENEARRLHPSAKGCGRSDGERALAWLDAAHAAEDAVEREMAQMAATRHTIRSLSAVPR